jgi:glucose/arabinose dehydrogenase
MAASLAAFAGAVAVILALVSPAGAAPRSPFDLRPATVRESEGDVADAKTLFLPPGFDAQVFAQLNVPAARGLALAPNGSLYVSIPRYGVVDGFTDANRDGFADSHEQVLSDVNCPHGMVVDGGWLYVAESERIERFPLPSDGSLRATGPPETLVSDLPAFPCQQHGYRPLLLAPDQNALYTAIASTCNACIEEGPGAAKAAKLWRYPLTSRGPGTEVARGLRNVTDLALNPWDRSLWGVGSGRDDLGDEAPPELITRIEAGGDYGWPHCYQDADGNWRPDPDVPPPNGSCAGRTAPTLGYQAHSVPLGLAFHDGTGLPPAFGRSLFVTLHGSWNHSAGVGYKLIRVPLDASGAMSGPPQEFALGWLTTAAGRNAPERSWGRPVDVVVAPDGALFVSDDRSGMIIRISYKGT